MYSTVQDANKKVLLGGIVTDVTFNRFRLERITISSPNGQEYNIVVDDCEMICLRVIRCTWGGGKVSEQVSEQVEEVDSTIAEDLQTILAHISEEVLRSTDYSETSTLLKVRADIERAIYSMHQLIAEQEMCK